MLSQIKLPIWTFAAAVALPSLGGTALDAAKAETVPSIVVAQAADPAPVQDDSLEAKMARRFPQKVKVGDLIGLPIIDDNHVTLGHVTQLVRSPEGKVKLIVSYSRWFGWFGRPVAVPIEAVASLAKQIVSIEMPRADYEKAPTWTAGTDTPIPEGEIIRIAVMRG